MRSSLPYFSTLTLLITAASMLSAQEAEKPDVTQTESNDAAGTLDESTAPDCSLSQGAPFWREGTITASLKDGDLILKPNVSKPDVPEVSDPTAPALCDLRFTPFTRIALAPKPKFVRGDYSVLVAGQNVKHTGRYMVSRFEQFETSVSLEDDLLNPVIFRTSGGPKLTVGDVASLIDSEKPTTAYFVNDSFAAQNLQRLKMAEMSSSSGSDSAEYIVVLREVQGYQAVKPGVVTKVIDEKSEPTVLIQYSVTKTRMETRTRTINVTRSIEVPMQVDEAPEAPKPVQGPKSVTKTVQEAIEQEYSVCVPFRETMTTSLSNPQLLLSVTPDTPGAGPAFAPVQLSATSLPVGTKVLMVNSPAEAARVYQQLRSVLTSNGINDLPFTPVFLVNYAAAD